eukprot:TRINITY_DN741_c0_g1_i13.p1 TRINITY_DN741_c0_g1~~TRINITY_DN741_c0_g1_i13.p1  ORF type:complete len:393 (-),score=82.15 TRINITY_DN741_c0_g1_i13:361-1539(-)
MQEDLQVTLKKLSNEGLYKKERIIVTPQGSLISVATGQKVLNFCANNYLGLANNQDIIQAGKDTMDKYGYGLSSVRFICGTQQLHKDTEKCISQYLKTEDSILFSSCFDANGGVFEALLNEQDAIISDELNHASIIDGVRLCKAKRFRYKHSNMEELEKALQESSSCRYRAVCTDGVFSMDGDVAKLAEICELCEKYDSLVMIDDSHATGYLGATGRGTHELTGVWDKVDIITTTFGKALGGASGGCVSGRKEIIEMLRQKSRPYLFSNTVAPAICGGLIKCIDMLTQSSEFKERTMQNANRFREKMTEAGFTLAKGNTAIVPVMLFQEPLAVKFADMMLKEGIYVVGFCYPVVPKGKARIRTQLSAAHTFEEVDKAVEAFIKVGKELKVIE